ncbi:MAG: hypothetical protein JWM56_728 [Candidatus Peribacteria bacterium]|nr:hypothetical protein [Candidatus Peribacteria bacterium]
MSTFLRRRNIVIRSEGLEKREVLSTLPLAPAIPAPMDVVTTKGHSVTDVNPYSISTSNLSADGSGSSHSWYTNTMTTTGHEEVKKDGPSGTGVTTTDTKETLKATDNVVTTADISGNLKTVEKQTLSDLMTTIITGNSTDPDGTVHVSKETDTTVTTGDSTDTWNTYADGSGDHTGIANSKTVYTTVIDTTDTHSDGEVYTYHGTSTRTESSVTTSEGQNDATGNFFAMVDTASTSKASSTDEYGSDNLKGITSKETYVNMSSATSDDTIIDGSDEIGTYHLDFYGMSGKNALVYTFSSTTPTSNSSGVETTIDTFSVNTEDDIFGNADGSTDEYHSYNYIGHTVADRISKVATVPGSDDGGGYYDTYAVTTASPVLAAASTPSVNSLQKTATPVIVTGSLNPTSYAATPQALAFDSVAFNPFDMPIINLSTLMNRRKKVKVLS